MRDGSAIHQTLSDDSAGTVRQLDLYNRSLEVSAYFTGKYCEFAEHHSHALD